jgi:hypothetical protein
MSQRETEIYPDLPEEQVIHAATSEMVELEYCLDTSSLDKDLRVQLEERLNKLKKFLSGD